MISDLKKLVRFKTITGNNEENNKALEWIRSEIEKDGHYKIKEFKSKGYSSLIITTQKTIKPKIFLAAHLDVAKAGNKMFMPKIKNGRLYGRGAYDMKFAIACYLKLLKEFKNNASKYDFGVMITTDEEHGGENGVKYLLKKGYKCDVVILPDGGENWKIEKAAKGLWCFIARSHGKSAHPAMPWEGVNALEELIDFLCELRKKFKKEPCGDPLHIHSTIDINELNTGKTGDNLPDYAEAMADIFFISANERKEIEAHVKEINKKFKGIKIETTFSKPSFRINTESHYINLFSKIAFEKYKIKKETTLAHSSSDAPFFLNKGIAVIETRPKGAGFHSGNEWINLKDLEKFYEILREFIERTARV
jgi:succinyl-diaminopimelate desuccinylase